ncbi:MAG: TIGR03435 family protein [Candidatus Solibacter sp.]
MKPAILGLFASCVLSAQAPDPTVTFEVASVKVSTPPPAANGGMRMAMRIGCTGGPGSSSPGQYTCSNANVGVLIREAYNLKNYQLPNFNVSDGNRYDIAAKIPAGSSKEQVRTMLQNLLAERFKLTYHLEKKEMQVYDLVLGKNGVKMKVSPPEEPPPTAAAGGPASPPPPLDGPRQSPPMGPDGFPVMAARRNSSSISMMGNGGTRVSTNDATMQAITMFLSNQLGRPVTDNTGLTGKYDYVLTFSREGMEGMGGPSITLTGVVGGVAGAPPPSDAPTIFAAVQEQLGLKLEQKKGSVDIFIVDHVEKNPVEN